MKDFIVLIATVLLGVAIAALVLGLKSTTQTLNTKATDKIDETFNSSYCIVLDCNA